MKNMKMLLLEMSEEELRKLLFPENEYKPLWRWMQSSAGRETIPNYDDMKWSERAKALSELADWTIGEMSLRTTFLRFDATKRRK